MAPLFPKVEVNLLRLFPTFPKGASGNDSTIRGSLVAKPTGFSLLGCSGALKVLSFDGVTSLKINENILRAETAAVSAISIISYLINL